MAETSFLSQLEQRTQQVKITLANLEAEKVRIEGQIAALQPTVPHYDALIAAERALAEANVAIEPAATDAPPQDSTPYSWNTPSEQPSNSWGS